MVTKEDITLSITTLNRPTELAATLRSAGSALVTQVIVNGGDASRYDGTRSDSTARFITNTANLGVTGSWNQGIVMSDTRYVVLSGDDLLYDPNWVEVLVDRLNDEPSVAPISLSEPTRYSAFCVDKATIPALGWFDHNYSRVYYEDEDWFLRTQEYLGSHNEKGAFERIPERLDVVHRRPHTSAPWNSIPNRVYFWRKWERLTEESADSFYLREDIIVRRRLPEPSWPSLSEVAARYAAGNFGRSRFSFDLPALSTRILTKLTTNGLFVGLRRYVHQHTNPEGMLR